MRPVIFSPSILSADFTDLGTAVRAAVQAGAAYMHVDVMDGLFVPNISIGVPVVASLRPLADELGIVLDTHLMIEQPERYVAEFARAGSDIITVHVEATRHLHRTLEAIREAGAAPGVTLNPATPLSALEEALPLVDLVLIMSVNPGFGGQKYIPGSTARIRRLRAMLDAIGSGARLEVDGGIYPGNVAEVVAAGADVIVAGSAVFGGGGDIAANLAALRTAVETVAPAPFADAG